MAEDASLAAGRNSSRLTTTTTTPSVASVPAQLPPADAGIAAPSSSAQPEPEDASLATVRNASRLTGHGRGGSAISFPTVLFEAVSSSQSDALQWHPNGSSILIQREQFEVEFLKSGNLFKTSQILSFIRQLHLYGFTKLSPKRGRKDDSSNRAIHDEYFHPNFKRDQPNLLIHLRPRSKVEVRKRMQERKEKRALLKQNESTLSSRDIKISVELDLNEN